MIISKKIVASKIASYLNHQLSKDTLIDWCEQLMEKEVFEDQVVKEIVARIGLMDGKNFEISYEDLSEMVEKLGYRVKVEIV